MTLTLLSALLTPMTPTKQLVEITLGGSVADFIASQRGEGMGWRKVADALYERTAIRVSHETVRSWSQEKQAA